MGEIGPPWRKISHNKGKRDYAGEKAVETKKGKTAEGKEDLP